MDEEAADGARLLRPVDGYVLSVRLNAEESRALTEAARFHGMKLSTYIKREALRAASLPLVRFKAVRDD